MAEIKGIFLRGFDRDLTHQHLKEFFLQFGDIEEVILNKRQMFAIIEFKEGKTARLVLSREIFLQGKRLKISLRKPKPNPPSPARRKENGPPTPMKTSTNDDGMTLTEVLSEVVTADNFEMQISKLVEKIESANMDRKVEILCQSIHNSMVQNFHKCVIYPFGSSVTGLASKESDVDIFIDIGKVNFGSKNEKSPSELVMLTKKYLIRNYEFTKCIGIPKARVPILKCFHKPTQLNCDINFQNALGIYNSELIKYYLSLDPKLRTITMFIKYWAKVNYLTGPGNLTSYALVMLFLFYVQQLPQPILPTVEILQDRCASVNVVQGWPCHFDRNPKDRLDYVNNYSIVELLCDFFSFCANMEFDQNVLLLNSASVVPRYHFTGCAPENSISHRYKLTLAKANADPIALDKVMCVLDPFALNHNITSGVGLREMNKLQIRCFKSAEVCKRIGNKERGLCLQSILGVNAKPKKVKFPYLEYWKENDVKLFIPMKSFNPNYCFESSEVDLCNISRTSLMELLMKQVEEIFEKVLRFSVVKKEVSNDQPSTGKQVVKVEGMEDVHSCSVMLVNQSLTIHFSTSYHIWNGRSKAYKEFSFPNDMKMLDKEMHVTNYIVDTFYKSKQEPLQKVDIKCVLVPIMDYRCLEMCITSCDSSNTFKPMITLLLTLLHNWLSK